MPCHQVSGRQIRLKQARLNAPESLGVGFLGLLALVACDPRAVQSTPEELSRASLAVEPTTFDEGRLWPNPLPVCFELRRSTPEGGGELGEAPGFDYGPGISAAMEALDETWAASSGLDFDMGSLEAPRFCDNSYQATETLKIGLRGESKFGGGCSPYYRGAVCEVALGFANGDGASFVAPITVHEVGHALGIWHEHQRAGADGGWESALCENELANVSISPGDLLPFPTLKLTVFDPFSVMNYCADENGGAPGGFTAIDALGIDMIYPSGQTLEGEMLPRLRIDCLGGFNDSSAAECVVRADVGVSLQPEYLTRGALPEALQRPYWEANGSTISTASNVEAGFTLPTLVKHTLVDFFQRERKGQLQVVPDDGKFTAILCAALL